MTEDTEAAVAAALEPHEPSAGEIAARERVRADAAGLTHAGAEDALEAAVAAAGDLASADASTRAAVAEWQRITDLLFDHGGPYAPDADAYVQGQLRAREHHRR
ncbi:MULTISPECIES: hypothetical protein [unclassified Streptomyces]|uniref:hypothetical protein n=1 Tax=unclassified Streptomyces TaxID=2593676 RepID=UPI00225ABEA0|nr:MULTISPECIES: hypothetical protein [unclassified Streptomyces]MCX4526934.1 hypothetical protein [Streptomyces sp. NBC_01551]MCX4542506.1 hypothetical protein [Streptomyces sp. NBC_01565]